MNAFKVGNRDPINTKTDAILLSLLLTIFDQCSTNVETRKLVFKHFDNKNQLPGLSKCGILVENGLNLISFSLPFYFLCFIVKLINVAKYSRMDQVLFMEDSL